MLGQPALIRDGPAYERAGLIHRVSRASGNGPHPAVVMLHGLGGDEDVMWIFARTLPRPETWLVAAPRAVLADGEGGFAWHARAGDDQPGPPSFEAAADAVARFIRALPDLYEADPAQVYLMGFSQGAATAIAAAQRNPRLVRGIVSLMGFAPESGNGREGDDPLEAMPIFMAAGLRDTTIPIGLARASADTLRRAGARLEYHEYDTAHKMNAAALADLRAWWKAQR